MAIKETRSHYRYSKDEKKHIKRWGNVVLVLLLIAVLGTIYAYLRFDGMGLNDLNRSNSGNTTLIGASTESEKAAKYPNYDDEDRASTPIFDELDETGNETVTNNNDSSAASPSNNTAAAPPAVTNLPSLDGASDNPAGNNSNASSNAANSNTTANGVELPPIQLSGSSNQSSPAPFSPQSNSQAQQPAQQSQQPEPLTSTPEPEPAPPATSAPTANQPSNNNASSDPNSPRPLTDADLGQPLSAPSAPSNTSASQPASSSNVGIAFQVGSFSSRENAERRRADLAFLGIQAQVMAEGGQYRVITARSNGAARQRIEDSLRREGIDYFPRF